jgi:ERCC4-related helicase
MWRQYTLVLEQRAQAGLSDNMTSDDDNESFHTAHIHTALLKLHKALEGLANKSLEPFLDAFHSCMSKLYYE